MDYPEVLFTSTNAAVYLICPQTNVVKETYKETGIAPKTLNYVGGSYIIGAHATKPLIQAWLINKKKLEHSGTFHCRGVVKALAVSPCAEYCVGAIGKELHIWQVHTGELLAIISRHLQDITCVKFSSDSAYIFSGAKDGHVFVWDLVESMSPEHKDELQPVKPQYVWTNHTAEITDIYPGVLGVWGRVATTSVDMTCRIYELENGLLLSTIVLSVPIFCVVMDIAEHNLFLGTTGILYRISLYEKVPKEQIINDDDEHVKYELHKANITSLSLSFDGRQVGCTSTNGQCIVFDIDSMSLRTNTNHPDAITNSFFGVKPEYMYNPNFVPSFQISAFQREFKEVGKYERCASLVSKPLTLMHENEMYSTDVLNGCVSANESDPILQSSEDSYQEKPVEMLTDVNSQLYTYLLNKAMN